MPNYFAFEYLVLHDGGWLEGLRVYYNYTGSSGDHKSSNTNTFFSGPIGSLPYSSTSFFGTPDAPGEGWRALKTNWSMWPAFNFIIFAFVPVRYRIAVMAMFSYVWLCILSFVSFQNGGVGGGGHR